MRGKWWPTNGWRFPLIIGALDRLTWLIWRFTNGEICQHRSFPMAIMTAATCSILTTTTPIQGPKMLIKFAVLNGSLRRLNSRFVYKNNYYFEWIRHIFIWKKVHILRTRFALHFLNSCTLFPLNLQKYKKILPCILQNCLFYNAQLIHFLYMFDFKLNQFDAGLK